MSETNIQPRKNHLAYLDSSRGIAAMAVVLYHYINWKYDQHLSVKLLSMVLNGADAVSFFFVLSGFVLSYKYIVLKQPLDIRKYFITRFFRLFPPFFAIVLLDCLYWERHDLHLQSMYEVFILNRDQFWQEVYLFKKTNKFYVPGWSLVIELTVSFFMPFAIAMAKTSRKLIPWFVFTTIIINYVINPSFLHFALGLLLSCYYVEVTDISFRETKWYKYRVPLLIAAFLAFCSRDLDRIIHFGPMYDYLSNFFQINFATYTAFGSFIVLAAILHSHRLQRLLNLRILRFYGKISYGVYLVHWEIVTAIFEHWNKMLSMFNDNIPVAFCSLLVICIALTTALAVAMHYLVELPSIRLGKKITDKLKPSVIIP